MCLDAAPTLIFDAVDAVGGVEYVGRTGHRGSPEHPRTRSWTSSPWTATTPRAAKARTHWLHGEEPGNLALFEGNCPAGFAASRRYSTFFCVCYLLALCARGPAEVLVLVLLLLPQEHTARRHGISRLGR